MEDNFPIPPGLTTNGLIARRYMARIIDSIAIGLVGAVVAAVAGALLGPAIVSRPAGLAAVLTIAATAYGGVLESSRWQATVGKKLFGMRVFAVSGARLSLGRACLRAFVKDGPFFLLALLPFALVLQLFWLALHVFVVHQSNVNQAIHDRVIGSFVATEDQTMRLNLSASA